MSLYEQNTAASNSPAVDAPGTMAALSDALANAHEAVARVERLADNLSGGIPQSVGATAGKPPMTSPPVASIIRDAAGSLNELAARIDSACYRIETAF